MTSNPRLARAVRIALITSAATASVGLTTGVSAQDQEQTGGELTGTMTVTGSRIARQDFEATSPVVTIGEDSLKLSGQPQIETVINGLPQFVPSVTTTSNNPSNGGQANLDLRGLGLSRTLVLVDGMRVQPSNVTGVIDLNSIPAALIETIEVLTGGASSAYGSDAIAGVVNVRLKKSFEGIAINAQSSLTDESDGRTTSANLMVGGNFGDDRGNAVVVLSYDKRDQILAGERDFSQVALGPQLQPLGSTTILEGRYTNSAANPGNQTAYNQVFGQYGAAPGEVPNVSAIGFNADGSIFSVAPVFNFRGDTSDPGFNPASYSYNYSPVNYLQLPLIRRQVAGLGRYDLHDRVEAYSRFTYTTYEADQQLAATPVGAPLTIPVDNPATPNVREGNPFIPTDLATILASRATPTATFNMERRMGEVGPRTSDNNYDVVQGTIGFRGDFEIGSLPWNWDFFGSWGRTERTELQGGNVSRSRLQSALNNPNALSARGCTNFNPFGQGNISPACGQAIAIKTSNITELEQINYVASFTGGLFDLPAGKLQTALGVEYRENKANFRPDEFLASGDVVGFNSQLPISGSNDVLEPFAEVSIPVLADLPFFTYLGLEGGYRNSNYDLGGSADTYKVALDWRPIESIKLRGSFNTAIRAPNLDELFRPVAEGFPAFQDPCWNGSAERTGPNATQVNALCAAQGAAANFPQGNSQVRTLTGGNPSLLPEEADTYTFGIAWTPSFGEHRLRMSADYFTYEMDKVIGTVGSGTVITRCFNAQNANPSYTNDNLWCSLFSRLPSGEARDVQATFQNLGKRNVDGVDVQVDYSLPLPLFGAEDGRLTTNLVATKLLKWQFQEDPVAPLVDVDGTITINIAEAFPEWKAVAQLGYAFSDWSFNWHMRFIGGMDVVNNDATRTLPTNGAIPTVDDYLYHRLTTRWQPTDGMNFTLGIDNLTDKDPPIYTSNSRAGVQANTDPSTYDVLGRRYFLNVEFTF